MSDDMWRRTGDNDRDDDHDDGDDFGELRFSDDEPSQPALRFGESDTGPLPHWTQPPTGEVPRLFGDERTASAPRPRPDVPSSSSSSSSSSAGDDEVDVWGSYSGSAPRPIPDRPAPSSSDTSGSRPRVRLGEPSGGVRRDPSGGVRREPSGPLRRSDDPTASGPVARRTADTSETRRTVRVADESGSRPRPRPTAERGPRPGAPRASSRPKSARPSTAGAGGRDMPTAVAVGLLIAAAFIGALLWKPIAVLAIVVLVCGLAAVEFFDKVTERGYHPATIVGIAAAVCTPLAAYWVGEGALPLVLVLALMASGVTFVGADGVSASPMPNMAITSLGIVWIGLMGSYAALLAGVSNVRGLDNVGTDTLFILACGVVANDVGALFVGSAAGRTPLRQWISPNKTLEGFLGGGLATIVVVWIVSLQSDTWNDVGEALLLAIVIALLAPLGDLVESMFKRNLDIKDFGTVVRGHGGVLDRFDGFLFVLPAAYYLLQVLEPFAS